MSHAGSSGGSLEKLVWQGRWRPHFVGGGGEGFWVGRSLCGRKEWADSQPDHVCLYVILGINCMLPFELLP